MVILVPRGRDPFGQHQESRPLASSGRIPFPIGNSKTIELTGREAASIMADSTPTKRYSTPVCRTCNQNIIAKNHPLDLFGPKATNEGISRDLEKFCRIKIAFEDGLPSRICRSCYVKITKFQEFVKMAENSKAQQESVIRSKRGKSIVESPSSTSSPSSRREKKKSKVSFPSYFVNSCL